MLLLLINSINIIMKITIANPDKATAFSTVFRNLKLLSDYINVHFSDSGIYMQCLDNNHCCLFECKISKNWFDSYEFDSELDAKCVGFNSVIFYKVIHIRQSNQEIDIRYNGLVVDKVFVDFTKGDNNFNKSFEIPTIDLDSEMMQIPDNEDTTVDLVIDTKQLSDLASELILFSEILTLKFSEHGINFTASGSEGKMHSCISLDNVNEYAIGEKMVLKQSYSLKYLNIMCNFGKLSKEIVLGFCDNRPMCLTYNLDRDSQLQEDEEIEKNNYVSFYLAPRIDDDDDDN